MVWIPDWDAHVRASKRVLRRRELDRPAWPEVRVTHPAFGSCVVKGIGNLDCIDQAAKVWGVDWYQVIDAQVWALEGRK